MNRRLWLAKRSAEVGLLALMAPSLGATMGQQAIFRSIAEAVTVHVSVRRDKALVHGLTSADFVVTDQTEVQTAAVAGTDPQPLDVTLIVDVSDSMQHAAGYAEVGHTWTTQLVSVITHLFRPDDRLQVWNLDAEARQITARAGAGSPDIGSEHSGGTVLLDTLTDALMLPVSPGRERMILVLTDGWDRGSVIPDNVRNMALDRSDAVIQAVVIRSVLSAGPSAASRALCNSPSLKRTHGLTLLMQQCGTHAWLLDDLTARTGGHVYYSESADDVSRQLAGAIDEWRSGYLLSYVPSNVPTGGWHAVTVKVRNRPEYAVTARRGYWRQ